MRLEDILPAEYFIPTEKSKALAKLELYVIDEVNHLVATHAGWERFDINYNHHRVPRRGGAAWFRFSGQEAAEKFVTKQLKRDLEDFAFQYVDNEAYNKIMYGDK